MSSECDELARAVIDAASRLERSQTSAACTALIECIDQGLARVGLEHIQSILRALRKNRYFDLMERVAHAAVGAGHRTPRIRRQYAQALIEQGQFRAAIDVLEAVVEDTTSGLSGDDWAEHAEAKGLLGSAYKRSYVNAVNSTTPGTPERFASAQAHQDDLHAAIDAYSGAYDTDRARYNWHGINTAALVSRGVRDGIGRETDPDPRAIAGDILTRLDSVGRLSYEAGIARKDLDGWQRWVETSTPDELGVRLATMLESRLRISGALTDIGELRAVLRGHDDVTTRRAAEAASAQQTLLRDDQMARFHHVILMAFNRSELEQILRLNLDVRLAEIAPEASLSQVVYEVLRWAQARDVLPRLIRALAAERPDRDDVQELYRTFKAGD